MAIDKKELEAVERLGFEVAFKPSYEDKFMNAVNKTFTSIDILNFQIYIDAINDLVKVAKRQGYLKFNDVMRACNKQTKFLYGDLFGWYDTDSFFYSVRIATDENGFPVVKLPKKDFIEESVTPVRRELLRTGAF